MINFELYRIFVAVAKEENITRASEKLNISQPAITKQIKNLESQLNMILFERKSKGLKLTIAGKELYEKLKNPIEHLNKINEELCKNIKIKSFKTGLESVGRAASLTIFGKQSIDTQFHIKNNFKSGSIIKAVENKLNLLETVFCYEYFKLPLN